MKKNQVQVYLGDRSLCYQDEESIYIEYNELVRLALSKELIKHLFKYNKLQFFLRRVNELPVPFLSLCMCRLICKGKIELVDEKGKKFPYGLAQICALGRKFFLENMTYKKSISEMSVLIDALFLKNKKKIRLFKDNAPLYLRLDLTNGLVAGGSVGHIAGVVNNLEKCCSKPVFVSTDVVATVNSEIEQVIIRDEVPYRNVSRISAFMGNLITYPVIERVINKNNISFIYQRSGLDIYAGAKAAIEYDLPYVLEYNGSEIWCEEHWGSNRLRFIELAGKIERLTFEKADLITCVSAPLKDQLVEQGIAPDKIMVNPNGVDPDIYRPEIDGRGIRSKYGIKENTIVIGFIGTFGAWHGAELLALAFNRLTQKEMNVHLLLIGDGMKMPEVKKNLENTDKSKYSLTGLIPQKEGPEYLAACDILVNPTIPNADGTPFFGSPTKLFEYMAMGKAIVASDMYQMSEVLLHNETALLVKPGNVNAIADSLFKLVSDENLRRKLGMKARIEVCRNYTWEIHTKKIVDRLEQIMNV